MSFTVSMSMHTAALAECSHSSCHAAAAVGQVAGGLRHPAPGRRGSMARASAAAVDRLSTRSQDLAEADLPPPPPPLKPVPVIHTQAYLVQTQQLPQVPQLLNSTDEPSQQLQQQHADLDSNALVWALKKVDDQLNQVEQQPSELHQAIYNFSNGPVGQATSKGVQVAAKVTMTATIEAAKVAAPVGQWALQQGFKAAVGLVGAAIQQERQQKQKGKGGKSDKRR